MGLAIGLGLDARAVRAQGGTVAAPPNVALDDLPRDRMIYDSRASVGGSTALVALSGTALEPGTVIDLRAWDGTAEAARADGAAVADADGRWSAVLEVPRTALWLHPEARADGGPWMRGPARRRLAAGHVIALWQQSEHDNAQKDFYDLGTDDVIADPEAVQMIGRHLPGGTAGILHCADWAEGMRSALAAWAAQWIALVPGEKVMLVWQTKDGSSWNTAADDGTPAEEGAGYREWSDDLAMHALATGNGATTVGLAFSDWYASPRGRRENYVRQLLRLWFDVDDTGAASPAVPTWDHGFTELYGDYEATRWHIADPHRFESEDRQIEDCRGGVRADWDIAAAAGRILAPGLANLSYLNGYDDGAGGWTDYSHPGRLSDDGMNRFLRFTALQMAAALGRYGLTPPEFDRCEWEVGGAYIELWSSVGAVTTERLARGEPAIDAAAFPWATEVAGFRIDGTLADRAEIVSGRVRVYPLAGGTFDGSEVLTFGANGAAGNPAGATEDALSQDWWMNLPMVDMGVPILGRVPILPVPDAAVLANAVQGEPGAPQMWLSTDDPGQGYTRYAQGPVSENIGAGRHGLVYEQWVHLRGYGNWISEVQISDHRFMVEILDNSGSGEFGTVKAKIGRGFNANWAEVSLPNVLNRTRPFRIRVGARTFDGTRDPEIWVQIDDGAPVLASVAGNVSATDPGPLTSSKTLTFGADAPMARSRTRFWWGYQEPGIVPAGTPDFDVDPNGPSADYARLLYGGAPTPL